MPISENNRRIVVKYFNSKKDEQEQDSKKRINWSYNNRTEQSYKDAGLIVPERLDFQIKDRLAKLDPKGKYVPIRSVKKIIRLKATDWDTKYEEQKEYLIYYENWEDCRNFLGRKIGDVTSHLQGEYDEVMMEDVVNDYGDLEGQRFIGTRPRYYIPFSKKAVDDIIATSQNTNKDNIKFCVKTTTMRNDDFTYEQFTALTFDECQEVMRTNGGLKLFDHYQKQIVKERQEKIRNKQYG